MNKANDKKNHSAFASETTAGIKKIYSQFLADVRSIKQERDQMIMAALRRADQRKTVAILRAKRSH